MKEKGKLIESPERTPMPPTNCWCSNDSATCKKCWPERAGSPRQPSADIDVFALTQRAKTFCERFSDEWKRGPEHEEVWYVEMAANFAASELREVSEHPVPAPDIYEQCAKIADDVAEGVWGALRSGSREVARRIRRRGLDANANK